MIVPEEVSRIDVMEGPYPRSIRQCDRRGDHLHNEMPEQFEPHSNLQGILAPL